MQKNNAFCSICTVNYSAYAGVLSDSLQKAGNKEPHYVLIVDYDKKYKEIINKFGFKPVFLSELAIPKIDELIEKYSAFELANVLKPFFLEWLLKKHRKIDKLVYLDTDIYVYSPLNEIFEFLDINSNISVAITPHLDDYKAYEKSSDYSLERLFMLAGLYNGGFYALKNDNKAIQFLKWQESKLFNYGYDGQNAQMFADQKILDFAPILFDYVGVYRNKGYNVAHWNYGSNTIKVENKTYFVGNKKLVFFHFSHLKIDKKDASKSSLFTISLDREPILLKLALDYWTNLEKKGYEEIIKIPYGFNDRYKKPPLSFVNPVLAKEIELDETKFKLDSTKEELGSTKTALESTKEELGSTKEELGSTKTALESTKEELGSTKEELGSTKTALESIGRELQRIYSSREWKTLLVLQKIIKIVIPKGSARRNIAIGFWKIVKMPLRLARKMKRRAASRTLKPKKRKINLKSKKLVYVGHSYHNKTKSTKFLIDYLKEFYDVEVVLDESWMGKPSPDLSFIDESYLGVVFFQLLPPENILGKIKNDNIIFFPMYGGVRLDYDFWNSCRNLKIVNFSKTLHELHAKWKLESIFVQFFPPLGKFTPGIKDEVFFWQRLTHIDINTVIKLLGKNKVKIHIHRAIDPDQHFIQPSKEDEKKFRIAYSDWFETREEMQDVIRQKAIYVAPRELEGIGMSFLEAMAMGKAVIAVDNPTMNEYIEHGKNGYLFDLKKPKEIDLSNIEKVQKNAYKYMQAGRKKWEKDKKKILDFIKKA